VSLHEAIENAGLDPLQPIRAVPDGRTFVVAQLGQSLDGRIATLSGESRWINGAAALDHLHRLRAVVDAVVVGVGTVIADDPLLNVRRVAGNNPARVVIDPNGRLPEASRCLASDGTRCIVVTSEGKRAPSCAAEHIALPSEQGIIAPQSIIAALAARGLSKILIEGGAMTVSSFLDADAIDRLHLLVGPVILGSGKPGLSLRPLAKLADAIRPKTFVHRLADGDVLFDCELRNVV